MEVRNSFSPLRPALEAASPSGLGESGRQIDPAPQASGAGSLGLARRNQALAATGLTPGVIATIEGARAASTRTLYDIRWRAFDSWCSGRSPSVVSFLAPIGEVLRSLHDRLDAGLSFSTIKVWLAAISACHVGYDGK